MIQWRVNYKIMAIEIFVYIQHCWKDKKLFKSIHKIHSCVSVFSLSSTTSNPLRE